MLRYLYVVALVVWVGGLVVGGAIVAPSVFGVLQAWNAAEGRVLAGQVFGDVLLRLTWLSYAMAAVMFVTLTLHRLLGARPVKYGVRVGIMGIMLAMMLATTGPADGFAAVKGEPYQDVSARVACAVGFYGAVDLINYHDMKMFAKTREEAPELYRKGSPITYLDGKDVPMLLVHGSADETVPLSQSETFLRIAKDKGANCALEGIPGAPHTFDLQPKQRDLRPLVTAFFDRHLKR